MTTPRDRTAFSCELHGILAAHQYSYVAAAALIGCNPSMLSRISSGDRNPSRDLVEQISERLGCTTFERLRLTVLAGYVPHELMEDVQLMAEISSGGERSSSTPPVARVSRPTKQPSRKRPIPRDPRPGRLPRPARLPKPATVPRIAEPADTSSNDEEQQQRSIDRRVEIERRMAARSQAAA